MESGGKMLTEIQSRMREAGVQHPHAQPLTRIVLELSGLVKPKHIPEKSEQ